MCFDCGGCLAFGEVFGSFIIILYMMFSFEEKSRMEKSIEFYCPFDDPSQPPLQGEDRKLVSGKRKVELWIKDVRKRWLVWDWKWFPYSARNIERARYLRKNMTPAETKLRNDFLKSYEYKCYRQRPIDHFIADFYCAKKSLIIEVDGSVHHSLQAKEYDAMRTDLLNLYGLRVIRFSNDEVLNNFDEVCKRIDEVSVCDDYKPPLRGLGSREKMRLFLWFMISKTLIANRAFSYTVRWAL